MYSIDVSSMTTFAPSDPNCKSSLLRVLSISSLYWKPEHPPPSTTTLRNEPSWQISFNFFTQGSLSLRLLFTASDKTCGDVDKNIRWPSWCCEILKNWNSFNQFTSFVFSKAFLTLTTTVKHCEPLPSTHLEWKNITQSGYKRKFISIAQKKNTSKHCLLTAISWFQIWNKNVSNLGRRWWCRRHRWKNKNYLGNLR